MSKLIELLKKEPMTLIVNMPESTVKYAKAVEAAGAQAIMIKIDSSKDKSDLISLVRSVKIPVGVMIEDDAFVLESQMRALIKLGFDFFGTSILSIREWMLDLKGFGKIARLNSDHELADLTRLSDKPIDAVDAEIMPNEMEGKDLTVGDLQQYITICLSTGLPVIVPSQKMIRPSEVPIIWDTGAKGLIIDKKIFGDDINKASAVIKEFRAAVNSLKE